MHEFSRSIPKRCQLFVGLVLALTLFFNTVGTLYAAGTTGTINGTVTNQAGNTPLPDVAVSAVAPTGRYTAKTDARGFFSFTGLPPDTYTISFELPGFQPSSVTGITVFADSVQQVSQVLAKSLSTIGRVTARSQGGAYQPTQTQDTYTVTSAQIQTALGRSDAISESQLLVSLPGATYDSSGYPVLRGGRENEEGFQFEGIDYTDAFSSQFINSLALNPAVGSLQLTPGAGDASSGNAGTGSINLIAKRGAYPGFGSIQGTIQGSDYNHELGLEYGFATPNGRVSNYFAYQGTRSFGASYGRNADARQIGRFFTVTDQLSDDIVDNFVYKFGRNNNQSAQVFFQNELFNFTNSYGGFGNLNYKTGDPYFLANATGASGLTNAQVQGLIENDPFQPSATSALTRAPGSYFQPNSTLKFQYTNNLDSSTFLTFKTYRVNSAVTFDFPFNGQNVFAFSDFYLKQGGQRTGFTLDGTKQVGSKNLVQVGGKFETLIPTYDQVNPEDGFFSTLVSGQLYDFVPNTAAACPFGVDNGCGYLFNYLKNPGAVPRNNEQVSTIRHDFALYLTDTFSPSSRVKIQAGARFDGTKYGFGNDQSQYYAPARISPAGFPLDAAGKEITSDTGTYLTNVRDENTKPIVFEPRLAVSYQLGGADSLRASYGRSVEFPSIGVVDLSSGRGQYGRFKGIPANAAICGVTGNLTCIDYADQLFWANQNYLQGVPYQPVKPATFSNFDFSYSHQFPQGFGLKVTPFYRRGYDATALVASPRVDAKGNPLLNADGTLVLGPPTATNLGVSRTTGLEFLLTKEALVGFSGSLSATYINETSNVIPNSPNEDFFPSIPPASLALGNQYRVGFLSPFQATLAMQYKSKGGLRINPQIYYVRGYPYGEGKLTATIVNGKAFNVPNTNITDPNGSAAASFYIDPLNPGTLLTPNIAASRGTPEANSAGGVIARANIFTNLTVEFSKPGSRSTLGVQVFNLFGNVYSRFGGGSPLVTNTRYQPIATGVSGPLSGYSGTSARFPSLGTSPYYGAEQNGQLPYRIRPNQEGTQYQFYYNLKL